MFIKSVCPWVNRTAAIVHDRRQIRRVIVSHEFFVVSLCDIVTQTNSAALLLRRFSLGAESRAGFVVNLRDCRMCRRRVLDRRNTPWSVWSAGFDSEHVRQSISHFSPSGSAMSLRQEDEPSINSYSVTSWWLRSRTCRRPICWATQHAGGLESI